MKEAIMVVALGDNINNFYSSIKEFPARRKLIILSEQKNESLSKKVKEELRMFKIMTDIRYIEENVWEDTFRIIKKIKRLYDDHELLVNVSASNSNLGCAAVCAAFVNGIKVFTMENDKIIIFPMLKFSYTNTVNENKQKILTLLFEDAECCSSEEELSKKMKMSRPLISYHINGTIKSKGLKDMGLIDIQEYKGKKDVRLSLLGRLLIKNYVKPDNIIKNSLEVELI